MTKYKIIICDDDINQATNISLRVGIAVSMVPFDDQDIDYEIVKIATKYQEVLNYLDKLELDGGIYFLDIELDDNYNGVNLAAEIKKRDERAQIIFITAYNEYMPMTFERRIGAVDYINKIDSHFQERLNETVRSALSRLLTENTPKKRIFIYHVGRQTKKISVDEISYISTTKAPHKLLLVGPHIEAQFVGDIKHVDEENDFLVKISQSCLVNPENIQSVDLRGHTIVLTNGENIKFSRRFRHDVQMMVDKYGLTIGHRRFLS